MKKPPIRAKSEVVIKKSLVEQFKRESKEAFPNECYAILLGRTTGKRKVVEWLLFPDISGNYSDPNFYSVQQKWWDHAQEVAKLKDMEVLGDIHSHCYEVDSEIRDCSPSQDDWDRLDRSYVMGICVVSKIIASGRMRSSVRFWEASVSTACKEVD